MRENEERWRELWDEASLEVDLKKRLGTTNEINRLLGEQEKEKAYATKAPARIGNGG